MRFAITVLLSLMSCVSLADWHQGEIGIVAIGYDGKTISVGQEGYTGESCTCYSTWPNRYCLDASRDTFDKEYALLLSVKARNISVAINIDEATCKIRAIYEP